MSDFAPGYYPLTGGDYIPPSVVARADPCRVDLGIKRLLQFFGPATPGIRNFILSATPPSGYYWWVSELSGFLDVGSAAGLSLWLVEPNFSPSSIPANLFVEPLRSAILIGSGHPANGGAGDLFNLSFAFAPGNGSGHGGALLGNRIVVPPGWRILAMFEDTNGSNIILRMSVHELKLSIKPPRLQR